MIPADPSVTTAAEDLPPEPVAVAAPAIVLPGGRARRLPIPGFVRLLLRNRKAAFGLALLTAIVLVALLAPVLARYPPLELSDATSEGPSPDHWFGTTQQGWDVFSQVVWGARVSLSVAASAAVIATLISAALGMTAAYVGGLVDEALNLVTNVFLVIPGLPLLIVVSSYLPFRGGLAMVLIIAFTTWAGEARVLRSQALSLRNRDFVQAAKVSGEPVWRIVFGEIMPNMTSRIAAGFLGSFVGAILYEAGLEFLGFGGSQSASWGVILFWAQNNAALETGSWWHFAFPGLALALTAVSLIFINYGIDEISNPRLQGIKMPKEPKQRRHRRFLPALGRKEQTA
jgi:peptide/nickel transport system permease protein